MAVHMRQKTVTFSGLDIVITGTEGNYTAKNLPQYYHLCTVKSIESTFMPATPGMQYPYPVVATVIINWVDGQGQVARFDFDIQDVTNQAGWTADLAGLTQAVADISAAKAAACAGSSGSTDLLLEQILASLMAFQDDEFIKVKDEAGDIFALVASLDEGTGVTTYSYINADGTAGAPVGAVTFLLGSAPVQRTPGKSIETGAGSVVAGAKSVTVWNKGLVSGTVLGVTIEPGEMNTWSAPDGDTLDAVAYDGTGTSLVITTVV